MAAAMAVDILIFVIRKIVVVVAAADNFAVTYISVTHAWRNVHGDSVKRIRRHVEDLLHACSLELEHIRK